MGGGIKAGKSEMEDCGIGSNKMEESGIEKYEKEESNRFEDCKEMLEIPLFYFSCKYDQIQTTTTLQLFPFVLYTLR